MADTWMSDFFNGAGGGAGEQVGELAKLATCKTAGCGHAPRRQLCRICTPGPRKLAHSGAFGEDLPSDELDDAAAAAPLKGDKNGQGDKGGKKRESTGAEKTAAALAARKKRRATREEPEAAAPEKKARTEAEVLVSKRGRGKQKHSTHGPPLPLCSNDSRT
jgi:hypothetical protein